MPLPSTMTPIATNTLTSDTGTVTFSNLPQNYTDLTFVINGGMSTSTNYSLNIRINSDSGSNYSNTRVYGNGSTVTSDRASNQTSAFALALGRNTLNGNTTIQIMNYSNTNIFKSLLIRSNDANYILGATVALWRSTAAITTVSISPEFVANWKSGTSFTIYGIKAAS